MADSKELRGDSLFELIYRIQLSVLYHQKRERFLDLLDKSAKGVAIIGGSIAFARILGEHWLLFSSAAVTVTSTLSLVFGFSDKSKKHAELARNFRNLEAEIEGASIPHSEAQIRAWIARQRSLEASEPPALKTLVIDCQNELARACGQESKVVKINILRRLTMHILD